MIRFDKPLLAQTVLPQSIDVIISFPGYDEDDFPPIKVDGELTYSQNSLRFIPDEPFLNFFYYPPYLISFTLFGDGSNAVRDIDGLPIDGNGNGFPGGNFEGEFWINFF